MTYDALTPALVRARIEDAQLRLSWRKHDPLEQREMRELAYEVLGEIARGHATGLQCADLARAMLELK